jgi:hypothetical protein
LVVDDQVQLETIEPVHAASAPLGEAVKHAMRVDAPVVTDPDGQAVNELNTGGLALAGLQVATQRNQGGGDQFDKARVAGQAGEISA